MTAVTGSDHAAKGVRFQQSLQQDAQKPSVNLIGCAVARFPMPRDADLKRVLQGFWQLRAEGAVFLRGPKVESGNVDRVTQGMFAQASRSGSRGSAGVGAIVVDAAGGASIDFLGHRGNDGFEPFQARNEMLVHLNWPEVPNTPPGVDDQTSRIAGRVGRQTLDETFSVVEMVGIAPKSVPVCPECRTREEEARAIGRFRLGRGGPDSQRGGACRRFCRLWRLPSARWLDQGAARQSTRQAKSPNRFHLEVDLCEPAIVPETRDLATREQPRRTPRH